MKKRRDKNNTSLNPFSRGKFQFFHLYKEGVRRCVRLYSKIIYPIIFLFFLLALLVITANAKLFDERINEELLEGFTEEIPTPPIADIIEYYEMNPIILRKANSDELLQLPFFSSSDWERILEAVNRNQFITKKKIEDSLSLTIEQSLILERCTKFETAGESVGDKFQFRARSKNYISKIRGIEEEKFSGSPLDFYQRGNYTSGSAELGLLTDKDIGEISLLDFFSGYLKADVGNFRFIIGDYTVEAGMGNLLWKSYGLRKGSSVISTAAQSGSGINPSRSSIEGGFLRGGVLQYSNSILENISFKTIIWASDINRAALADSSGNFISSVYSGGYFRTESDIEKKDNLNEQIYGGLAELRLNSFTFGVLSYFINYSKEIASDSKSIFSGKSGLLSSVYSYYIFSDGMLGTEISLDAKGNTAIQTGLELNGSAADAAFHFRLFPDEFRSPFGYNFGENSFPANEESFYAALRYKGIDKIVVSSFLDIYRTFAKTYTCPVPVKGLELFCEPVWSYSKTGAMSGRIRYENKTGSTSDSSGAELVYQGSKTSLRLEVSDEIANSLRIRFRFETAKINFGDSKPDESGYSGFMEFDYQPFKI
ncbi:MAG: hypothetical protein QG635_1052, partial [Bacteroidota bacterium]|nr:hypothetical protein [Bacteroidota bacterium]